MERLLYSCTFSELNAEQKESSVHFQWNHYTLQINNTTIYQLLINRYKSKYCLPQFLLRLSICHLLLYDSTLEKDPIC
jgi:hypothetical protein